jgi:hypothetical protein
VGVSRGTVERALEADRAPRYDRLSTGSMFDAYQAKVRTLLAVTPTMPASTLAERVEWPGSEIIVSGQGGPDQAGVPAAGSS